MDRHGQATPEGRIELRKVWVAEPAAGPHTKQILSGKFSTHTQPWQVGSQ